MPVQKKSNIIKVINIDWKLNSIWLEGEYNIELIKKVILYGNVNIITHIKERTLEICLAAVKRNGQALEYIKEQTLEICMAAVQQCGLALKYVK